MFPPYLPILILYPYYLLTIINITSRNTNCIITSTRFSLYPTLENYTTFLLPLLLTINVLLPFPGSPYYKPLILYQYL